ncbi:sensor histidine kinase [Streptacidiphilus jiangxiensis]|uniref:histidine kinase n=1 Tax=Streptacidiphilus jiangxiensis TaxID=235985 RepID=A0A1H7V848_STRJI|nr:HAMP domain-containing sensor histidine kinase [Streptacidiphilus jiangxiensis]SEM05406.1 two-component system, OmpR family, sensor histidine kinase BaeS [Streptacidiphilus jiangxiensis]
MTARTPRRRRTLAGHLVLLTTVVAAVAALLTGLVAWQSAAHAAEQRERDTLTRQATLLSHLPALSPVLFHGAERLAGPNGEQFAVLAADGTVTGGAAPALDLASRATLLAGRTVSTDGLLAGQDVLVVGSPTASGGAVVLTEPYATVDRTTDQIRRDIALPLLVGLLGAALAGGLLARRLARPLTASAAVAHRLAEGERGVVAPTGGPREAAEIGRALTTLDQALARSENRQREFLLSVSHELRTPLTAVQGYAEALADGLIEPEQVPEVGRTLAEETRRLDRFLADLLALARLEADDFHVEAAATDLGVVVAEAAAFWSGPCASHGVELRVERPEAPLMVTTDPFRVRQLLDGLVQNALRVTPAGAPVVLAVHAEEGAAVLQVRDGGPGLTEDDIAVAFEPGALHSRYRATRTVGSGLGLAIAHRLTARLGGDITAQGHGPEGGACFTVKLQPPQGRGELREQPPGADGPVR